MKRRQRPREAVRVRVPEVHAPFIFVHGSGWHISILWNYGSGVEVPWHELRALLASSKSDIVIARKLRGEDLRFFESYRYDVDHEVHARLIFKDDMRWRSPRKR